MTLDLTTLVPGAYLRSEKELLLRAACTQLGPIAKARIAELLEGEIDWDYIFEVGREQGVLALVTRSLRQLHEKGEIRLPEDVFAQLLDEFRSNALHSLGMAEELTEVGRLLESRGFEMIAFKGPTLGKMAYGSLSLRQFGDLDILVSPAQRDEVLEFLIHRGYEVTLRREQVERILRQGNNLPLLWRKHRILLEVHWGLTTRAWPLSTERFDRRKVRIDLESGEVDTLHPEDLLIFLAVHGNKHFWLRLGWVCDVAELIRRHPDLDWAHITNEARRLGCLRMLRIALHLARNLLEDDLPGAAQSLLQDDPTALRLASQARERLFFGFVPDLRDRDLRSLVLHERLRDRLRFLRYRLGPAGNLMRWNRNSLKLLGKALRHFLPGSDARQVRKEGTVPISALDLREFEDPQ